MHWVCGVLDLISWRLTIYDSGVRNFSYDEVSKICAPLTNGLPWLILGTSYYSKSGRPQRVQPLEFVRVDETSIPQQLPGSGDCGVFTCKFIEYLSCGIPFNFQGDDMIRIRRRMAIELWSAKLFWIVDYIIMFCIEMVFNYINFIYSIEMVVFTCINFIYSIDLYLSGEV